MTARIDTTPEIIIEAMLTRLRTVLRLDPSRCYYTADSLRYAQIPKGGDFWIEVSDGGGQFDPAQQIGGGDDMCTESCLVMVTGYSRVLLDAGSRMDRRSTDPRRGLFGLKRRILKALVEHDLLDEDGNTFLREPLHAVRATPLDWSKEKNIGSVSVGFHVEFDWDLASE